MKKAPTSGSDHLQFHLHAPDEHDPPVGGHQQHKRYEQQDKHLHHLKQNRIFD